MQIKNLLGKTHGGTKASSKTKSSFTIDNYKLETNEAKNVMLKAQKRKMISECFD